MTDRVRIPPAGLNACLLALILLASLVSLLFGQADLPAAEVWRGLVAPADDPVAIVVRELRLPRVALGLLVGASLGLSGSALQGLLRNPLADPGVIGVSASAGLGAVIAIYFGISALFALAVPLFAMAGALLATLVLFFIASRDASVLMLILAGIGISSLATAAISLVMNFAASPMTLQDMVMWLLGSLENRTLGDLALAAPFIVLGWLCLTGVGQGLNALSLGEDAARTLGIDLKRLHWQVIAGSAASVGASVAVCGTIGFVGLVVPHFVRALIGYEPRRNLLPSALAGALLITLADMITRLPLGHAQLRLGVVTALIGAPVFLLIIIRTREAMR